MYLRQIILRLSLNIEHSIKVHLLHDIQRNCIDDFKIVSDYTFQHPGINDEILIRKRSHYINYIISRYPHLNYPIDVFIEIIPFGSLINFYKFYCENYGYSKFDSNILFCVKNIRNAAAHNNCIINNLPNKSGYYCKNLVIKLSALLPDIKVRTIQNRLKNNVVQDFIALLISANKLITSNLLKSHSLNELSQLFNERMLRNAYLYKSSPSINQTYDFCKKAINKLIY